MQGQDLAPSEQNPKKQDEKKGNPEKNQKNPKAMTAIELPVGKEGQADAPSSSKGNSWADQTEKEAQSKKMAQEDISKDVVTDPAKPSQKSNPRNSWAAVVQGNRTEEEGWKLEYVKPSGRDNAVKITQEEWDFGTECWKGTLVGYVPGLSPKFRDMANYVNNRWKDVQVPRVHMRKFGVFLFDFRTLEKMEVILRTRWFFQGHPLILTPWKPEMNLEDLHTDVVPVWVKFSDLHFSLWNPPTLSKMASYLGTPIKTDKLTAVKGKLDYARMLIEMRVSESVPKHVVIEGPQGMLKWPVIYEWKPIRCSTCKKIGHDAEQCRKNAPTESKHEAHTSTAPAPIIKDTGKQPVTELAQVSSSPQGSGASTQTVAPVQVGTVRQKEQITTDKEKEDKGFTTKKSKQSNAKKNLQTGEKNKSVISMPAAEAVIANVNPFAILAVQETMLEGDSTFDPGITPLTTNA